MSTTYSPISYFFVDPLNLNNADPINFATDAFGPVSDGNTPPTYSQYRTTSKVNADSTTKTKVYAICKGRILIQPTNTPNGDKINLILKPDANFAPIKIKYFIYRGVDMADWVDSNGNLMPEDLSNTNQPTLLQKIWNQFTTFYKGLLPDTTNASLIGYDSNNQPAASLIDSYFFNSSDINPSSIYQLPVAAMGDYIGNFSGTLGLDIVLDKGDYQLQNQTELFQLNLAFARASEFLFDITDFFGTTDIARYKEYIHQFMDAAAFWGSHINCGKIQLSDSTTITTNEDIYNGVLVNFQTANKLYVYIQGELGRSYNYYNSTRTLKGLSSTPENNVTDGWPILIKDTPLFPPSSGNVSNAQITLQYNVDMQIDPSERYIFIDLISPNNDTSAYPISQNILNLNSATPPLLPPQIGDTQSISINLQTNNLSFCASFVTIYANLTQTFPLSNYFDYLWPANFNTIFTIPNASADLSFWATYDKSNLLNLSPQLYGLGAVVQNKVVIDTGVNPNNTPITISRQLFIASHKRNSSHSLEYNNLNNDSLSGLSTSTSNNDQYNVNLFNDINCSTLLGQFTDNSDGNNTFIVNSLSLIHDSNYEKKNSYFLIGITNEEYNKLIYDNSAVQSSQILPIDADNVFFSLQEVSYPNTNTAINVNVLTKCFKKYKVGLIYEDGISGTMVTDTLYPTSPANDVFVYTIDGFYFFSKDFSAYQVYYTQFAKAKIEFRTQISTSPSPYNGEFGFDWLRIGDNGNYQGTVLSGAEPSYQSTIINGYHQPELGDTKTQYTSASGITLVSPLDTTDKVIAQMAFKALQKEYIPIPTQIVDDQYNIQYLRLYSQVYSGSIKNSLISPPFAATLRVLVTIDEPLNKLEFDYDNSLFSIDKSSLSDLTVRGKSESVEKVVTITCFSDFNTTQQIRVLAYPLGTTNKDDAQLAGIILLNPNDSLSRQRLKFVLVNVATNVTGIGGETGSFNTDPHANEEQNLLKALHQGLIDIEITTANISVASDPEFLPNGIYNVNGQFIDPNGVGLYQFLQQRLGATYQNYFTVFAFDVFTPPLDAQGHRVAGRVQGIGIQSVILYNGRGNMTLAHEGLHGLGLRHTQSDAPEDPIDFRQKYIYPDFRTDPNNATDNYMSYSGDLRREIWNWQVKLIYYTI